MATCFNRIGFLAFILLAVSCGKKGVAPSMGCSGSCRMFLTESYNGANFGGISGADSKCMTNENYPGSGTFKALLVDGVDRVACTSALCATGGLSEHKDWVLKPDTEYTHLDTTSIIGNTDSLGLLEFNLTTPFGVSSRYFSGLVSDWRTAADTCIGWTSSDNSENGRMGSATALDSTSISDWSQGCLWPASVLLCVKQ